MSKSNIKPLLRENVQRQKAFFASKEPGGLLAFVYAPSETAVASVVDLGDFTDNQGLAGHIYHAVCGEDGSIDPNEKRIRAAVENFVRRLRQTVASTGWRQRGDAIPCVYAHWDIGWHTAAMVGLPPAYSHGSWWLEPNLGWEEIAELEFDPDNPWLFTALHTHRALWEFWDEDYWTMPLIHRSPLDYANGLRGTELFVEMVTEPDSVKGLLEWCVDWQLQAEAFVYEGVDVRPGWGTGIMDTWGPDRAVWVNGDPVGLISREMMLEFEQPYTGRLFSSTGGGLFHNHTLGLYQADQVAATPGIHMQNFTRDPNRPTVEQTLCEDLVARDRIVEASLLTPILIDGMSPESLDSVLPIVRDGRFMLNVNCEEGDDPMEIVERVRAAGTVK